MYFFNFDDPALGNSFFRNRGITIKEYIYIDIKTVLFIAKILGKICVSINGLLAYL